MMDLHVVDWFILGPLFTQGKLLNLVVRFRIDANLQGIKVAWSEIRNRKVKLPLNKPAFVSVHADD